MICIKNGTLYTAVQKEPITADLLIKEGKIVQIAPNIDVEGAEIIDATGLNVYPGFVEAHCHTGMHGHGNDRADNNETSDPVTPHLRAIDAVHTMDGFMEQGARAGVTCICTGPGSSNAIGGTFVAMKTIGKRVDDMIVKFPAAMKCAFGTNPKTSHDSITSRMTTAAMIRTALRKAQIYKAKRADAGDDINKLPAYDEKSEALIPVLNGEIPLKSHVHQVNDIFTALRIVREFDVKITLEHVTEGHLIVEELAKEPVMLAVGPSDGWPYKYELTNRTWETPGILAKAGCHVSITTDAPVIPLHDLPVCAAKAVAAGMDEYDALRAITIHPAEHIGIADRVGSLEEGKDADIVIMEGTPLDLKGRIKKVLIEGKEVV